MIIACHSHTHTHTHTHTLKSIHIDTCTIDCNPVHTHYIMDVHTHYIMDVRDQTYSPHTQIHTDYKLLRDRERVCGKKEEMFLVQ